MKRLLLSVCAVLFAHILSAQVLTEISVLKFSITYKNARLSLSAGKSFSLLLLPHKRRIISSRRHILNASESSLFSLSIL